MYKYKPLDKCYKVKSNNKIETPYRTCKEGKVYVVEKIVDFRYFTLYNLPEFLFDFAGNCVKSPGGRDFYHWDNYRILPIE